MTQKQEKSYKINQPFSMHVEIDFEGTTQADGDVYTVTPDIIFDQLSYVFEKLKHKDVKITFKMQMHPAEKIEIKKKEG